jgi:hypothetical protein
MKTISNDALDYDCIDFDELYDIGSMDLEPLTLLLAAEEDGDYEFQPAWAVC